MAAANGQPPIEETSSVQAATPPAHTTWPVRGLTIPNFPAFTPKNIRVTSNGSISRVMWSCDGKRVAVCGTEKLARLWTPEKSFEIRNTIALSNGHSEIVDACAWNPIHPDLLCTASSKDMRIVFWDAKSKSPIQSLSLKPKQPSNLLYSPNGRTILVITKSCTVTFLNLHRRDDGRDEWVIGPEKLKHNESETEVITAVWNHPGSAIILGERGGLLSYFSYPELKRGSTTGAHTNGATSLALDPRGKYIVTSGSDSIVNLFDIMSWRVAYSWDCTDDQVNDLDFSYDGEFVAVAYARSLEIWATETGERVHHVTQQSTPCRTVAWHPWKFVLAYGGQSYQEGGNSLRVQTQAATLSFFGL